MHFGVSNKVIEQIWNILHEIIDLCGYGAIGDCFQLQRSKVQIPSAGKFSANLSIIGKEKSKEKAAYFL